MTATATLKEPPEDKFGTAACGDASASRNVYFDGNWYDAALYDGSRLRAGANIDGPAVVEYLDSIAVVPPRCHANMDQGGNLIVSIVQ